MVGPADRRPTSYSGRVLALTLGQAKNTAVVVAVVLVALAVVSAWVMKSIAQKVAVALILGLLAVVVWSQRTALQECTAKVRAEASADFARVDTTCSFFGRDVDIATDRDR